MRRECSLIQWPNKSVSLRLQALLITFVLCCFSTQVAAKDAPVKIDLGKGIVYKPCAKKAKPLEEGMRYGRLKKRKRITVTVGPGTLCMDKGHITDKSTFAVIGQAKSTFGRIWYQLRILDQSDMQAWLPKKYIELGERYTPKPTYTTTALSEIVVFSDRSLNVRDCPATSCAVLSSLKINERYSATKKASNGWYFVELSNSIEGWVSGRYISEVSTKVLPKEVVPEPVVVVEKPDPCTLDSSVTDYPKKSLWQVTEPILVSHSGHQECKPKQNLEVGQAVIPLGENKRVYKLSYVNDDMLKTGYFVKKDFKNQYQFFKQLPDDFDLSDSKTIILKTERYWQSWRYAVI